MARSDEGILIFCFLVNLTTTYQLNLWVYVSLSRVHSITHVGNPEQITVFFV